ncbi:MAG: LacI family DNA-binding transcriptional regulator [Maritimibacter sp.]|nr:LacI family DNA-binding transcriptional regulator [Maritimibacter sp.]
MVKKKTRSTNPKPASIRGIAKLTGFSSTTVSLVLNGRAGDYNISDETRDAILAKARELNYQPNIHARNLSSGRSDILGLMVPTLHNRFFGELAETFEALARAEGKLALIHVTRYERAEEDNAIRFFLSQNAECIVVANPMAPEKIAELCEGRDTQQIFIDATAEGLRTVSTDNYAAAFELTRAIIASMARAGHQGSLVFFGGTPDHQVTQLRLKGFRAALDEAGLPFADTQVIWSAFEPEKCYAAVRDYLRANAGVAGMFVNSIIAMEGITRYFPDDPETFRTLHYGVFDISPNLSLLTDLNIIGVRQDSQRIMEAAFDLYKSGQPTEGGTVILVPHEMVYGRAFASQRPGDPVASGAGRD